MINNSEIVRWSEKTGTSTGQIVRDHLVSHLIHGLDDREGFVFFGGTALHRTFISGSRLSEDIDLFLDPEKTVASEDILEWMRIATRKEFPELQVQSQGSFSDVQRYTVETDQASVRLQVVGRRHELGRYSVCRRDVALRYSDLPDTARIVTPDQPAFAAMKLAAYEDRRAARDLFDLDMLGASGALGAASMASLKAFRGYGPVKVEYGDNRRPTDSEWDTELTHQTPNPGTPAAALKRVRQLLDAAAAWGPD